MWLDNLKELKSNTGMSSKQIAEKTNLPERTVVRIFSGETANPCIDTIRRIVAVLGGSLDDIFAETKIVVGEKNLATLQEEVAKLNAENEILNANLSMLTAENNVFKDKINVLTSENDILRMKLEHKEEIIALHNYYKTLMSGANK